MLPRLATPKLAEMAKYPPRVRSGKPACQEVVYRGEEIDLDALPILQTWPQDGGRYLTLPMVITRDPKTGGRNVGMYRVQVLGRNTVDKIPTRLDHRAAHDHLIRARDLHHTPRAVDMPTDDLKAIAALQQHLAHDLRPDADHHARRSFPPAKP